MHIFIKNYTNNVYRNRFNADKGGFATKIK